jgi:hypothetical protein
MDSAVAEFVGINVCSYFCETDFSKYHQGSNPEVNEVFLDFFRGWSKEEHIYTKLGSLSPDQAPDQVSSYFNRWQFEIVEYVNQKFDCCVSPSNISIQHLASYRGHRGGNAHAKSVTLATRWNANFANLKTFFEVNRRLPKTAAVDTEERCLGMWMINHKKDKGEHEQTFRRELPKIFDT